MRIVHVIPTLCNGGTERFLISLLEGTSKDYENDIVVYNKQNCWQDKLEELGVNVTVLSRPRKVGVIKNFRELRRYFRKNKYDVVYAYTYYNAAFVLLAAMLSGVKIRIVHAHTSETEHKKTVGYKLYCFASKMLISITSTHRLACSQKSGEKLFRRKYRIINNGIDLNKYSYKKETRKVLRKEMGVDDKTTVIGIVGRLDKNKNQSFALDVFEEYHKINKRSILIVVGDGPEMEPLKTKVNSIGSIQNCVIFTGVINDASDYYNAFDVLLLTSYNEGFPYVLIEAQANGLPAVVSSALDKKVKINSSLVFANLDESTSIWIKKIDDVSHMRGEVSKRIKNYSVEATISEIIKIYGDEAI